MRYKEKMDEKTIVSLNVYFLLPMLAFWGLLTQKIDLTIAKIPFLYLAIVLSGLLISRAIAYKFFNNPKDISIVQMASVTGITGSIGIPLGLTIFGEGSVIYTSLINTMSMFFVYTVGTYIYSRGSYSIRDSFKNVFKMPIIWASIIAIIINISDIKINTSFFKSIQMGAYAAIVMQLIIFGIFLKSVKLREISPKLLAVSISLKFIIIPVFASVLLSLLTLNPTAHRSLMLEILVPIAITNVSLATIFECEPIKVTYLVFVSFIIFIPYLIIMLLLGLY